MAFGDIISGGGEGGGGPPVSYPEMTPGVPPQPPKIMSTPWFHPADPGAQDTAGRDRIIKALSDAYTGAQAPITPEAEDWLKQNTGWFGRNVVPALNTTARNVGGLISAAGTLPLATAGEILNTASQPGSVGRSVTDAIPGMRPLSVLGRDLPLVAASLPMGGGEASIGGSPLERTMARPTPGNPFARPIVPEPLSVTPQVVPSYTQADVAARQAARAAAAPDPAAAAAAENVRTKVLGLPPSPPTGETSRITDASNWVPGPLPYPPGYAPPRVPPVMTSQEGRALAGNWYQANAATAGKTLGPEYNNWVLKQLQDKAPSGPAAAIAGPTDPVTQMAQRYEQYRDQPMTLGQAQATYKALGDAVSAEVQKDGTLTARGRDLAGIQGDLRNMISPEEGATDPWSNARRAWAQSAKLDDIEGIMQRTAGDPGRTKTQLNNLLNNDKAIRGYSDAEKAAIQNGIDTGKMEGVGKVFASRLVPVVASGIGGTVGAGVGGILGAPIGMTAGGLAGEAVRQPIEAALRNYELNKLRGALQTITSGMPPRLPTGWTPP